MRLMAGKADGRTQACGVPATFERAADARMWARVAARATRRPWHVRHLADTDEWRAEPVQPLTAGQHAR